MHRFFCSLLVAAALACGRERPPVALGTPVPAPTSAARAPAAAPPDRGFIAVVVAGEAADLAPKASGRVEEVYVAPGAVVRQGAPIARIEVASARHELSAAQAGLREAQLRFDRRQRLARAGGGAVTAEELDAARRDYLQARARVGELKAAVAEAVLTAPSAGTIVERYLAPGALAGPDRPIARLVSAGEPRVRFAAPEDRAATLAPGQSVQIKVPPLDLTFTGRIAGLSPEIDGASRMIYGVATLDDLHHAQAGKLTTGLIARVVLTDRASPPHEARPAALTPIATPKATPPAPAAPETSMARPPATRPAPATPTKPRTPRPAKRTPTLPKW